MPAATGEVTVTNDGRRDFLNVSWKAAPGDVKSYEVSLKDHERIVYTLTVTKLSSQFSSLVPGRLYTVSVSTCSDSYKNTTEVQGRTREFTLSGQKNQKARKIRKEGKMSRFGSLQKLF